MANNRRFKEMTTMAPEVFISIVSHNNQNEICTNSNIPELSKLYKVIIKVNTSSENNFDKLKECGAIIIDESHGLGFGANNNVVFEYCRKKLNAKPNSIFIIANPDVSITSDAIQHLIHTMGESEIDFATINLFRDTEKKIHDNSVRRFPSPLGFALSFLNIKKLHYNKTEITSPTKVDWCSGSFMAIRFSHYSRLRGFDEKYFMYCEDIDICYRSKMLGVSPVYLHNIEGIHTCGFKNRNIFSKHFLWHVTGAIRFSVRRLINTRTKSRLRHSESD